MSKDTGEIIIKKSINLCVCLYLEFGYWAKQFSQSLSHIFVG